MPSRDEILAVYQAGPDALVAWVKHLLATQAVQLEQVVGAHQVQVANLTARIAQLEARLNKDSHNSHQPPSSDGPAKPPRPRSLRKRSGKKSGGQPGHAGVTRALSDDPDMVVAHVPTVCADCGAGLAAAAEVKRERRQVIEIPEPRPVVTEHHPCLTRNGCRQAVHKACLRVRP